MIYLVVGLFGGAICAMIAPSKRRSPLAWFCIGFLIPLIGLILILVMQPNPDPNQQAYGYPPQGYPPGYGPPQGYPQQPGYPPQGHQQQPGYPAQGYQQQPGAPQDGPPQQPGYPPQGYQQQGPPTSPQETALRQLDEQRMRGAIGDQEYQAKRAELLARAPS